MSTIKVRLGSTEAQVGWGEVRQGQPVVGENLRKDLIFVLEGDDEPPVVVFKRRFVVNDADAI